MSTRAVNICIFKVTFNWNQIWIRFQVHFWTFPAPKFINFELLLISFQGRTDLRKIHSDRFMETSGRIFPEIGLDDDQKIEILTKNWMSVTEKLKFRRNIWIINFQKPLLARFRGISRTESWKIHRDQFSKQGSDEIHWK